MARTLFLFSLLAVTAAPAQAQTKPATKASNAPPSQWELNGFLLGQNKAAIEHALGSPFQTIPESDGWVDRAYSLGRGSHAYMAFKFTGSNPDHAIAVQIAGAPTAPMYPFLGIHLGATRREVEAVFGAPTDVQHESDVNVDLLLWTGRNYSFEVDTAGRVTSIQLLAYDGMRDSILTDDVDPLTRFRGMIASGGGGDSLMLIVAPDLECFHDSTVVTFAHAPRSDVESDSSAVGKCLRALAAPVRTDPTQSAIRMLEAGETGMVYKWDQGPVEELFFKWFPGGHRLWEVRFR